MEGLAHLVLLIHCGGGGSWGGKEAIVQMEKLRHGKRKGCPGGMEVRPGLNDRPALQAGVRECRASVGRDPEAISWH